MTTLANLETTISAALRDSSNATFALSEIDTMVNQGIDAISAFYPKAVVDTSLTVSSSVFTYALPTTITRLYRVDIYSSAGSYKLTLGKAAEVTEGPNSGWERHGSVLYFPPSYFYLDGDVLHLFGYGPYLQLSASSSTTDLDVSAINALIAFCQNKAFGRLAMDRGLFQQWAALDGNTDVSMAAIAQARSQARQEWRDEMTRLRRLRK